MEMQEQILDTTVDANTEIPGFIGVSKTFALANKLITRDLNANKGNPVFSKFTKEDIAKYLSDPYRYEKQIRDAIIYIYGASPHFRRLIQYFSSLSDLSYIVSPCKIDPKVSNDQRKINTLNRNYRKTLNTLSNFSIRTQCPKILTVCLREDTFYGTLWETDNSIIIQQLPSDYCAVSSIEQNVLNLSFDFAYFDTNKEMLEYYPSEFSKKYNLYLKDRTHMKWQELDSPNSFAIKANNDILMYSIPPFVGILRELYDLEDYKALKLTKTSLENYAMLSMKLPMDKDGNWILDFDKAKKFWRNLDSILPDEIGSVLTPMDIEKIGFERNANSDTDTISDAEQNLFTAAGVSSLLFNNEKASANALALSVKADQAITYGIVKSIEDMLNRYIQSQTYGKNFKVTFLDCSPYNRKEMGDAYLKAASFGLPTISMYAASQGLNQAELDSMSFLEGTVLELYKMFKPLQNSAQVGVSLDGEAPTEEGGRPQKDPETLTETGEESAEKGDDWG